MFVAGIFDVVFIAGIFAGVPGRTRGGRFEVQLGGSSRRENKLTVLFHSARHVLLEVPRFVLLQLTSLFPGKRVDERATSAEGSPNRPTHDQAGG